MTLPPILEFLEDNQRRDVDAKVEVLHDHWLKLKNLLEKRLDLSAIYVKFHTEADFVNKQMDKLEESLRSTEAVDEERIERLEQAWESLVPLYQSTKNTGLTFIGEANKVTSPTRIFATTNKIRNRKLLNLTPFFSLYRCVSPQVWDLIKCSLQKKTLRS